MGHILGSTKGLARAVSNSRSETVTLVLTNRIGKALSGRSTVARSICFGSTGAEGFTDRFPDCMAYRFADRICHRRRKALSGGIGYGIGIRI